MIKQDSSRLVYSSDSGRVPIDKEKAKRKGGTASVPNAPDDGWVRLWRVKGGRGGKTVTLVTGVAHTDLENLAVDLRRSVGAGGGVREGAIEIQGDHRERLQKRLTDLGYRVKLAGG